MTALGPPLEFIDDGTEVIAFTKLLLNSVFSRTPHLFLRFAVVLNVSHLWWHEARYKQIWLFRDQSQSGSQGSEKNHNLSLLLPPSPGLN